MTKSRLIAAAAFFASMFASSGGQAGHEIFDPTVTNCTWLNCGSISMGATVMAYPNAAAKWEAAVYAYPGECLRVDETAMYGAGADDAITIVGPDGSRWHNDDFYGLRPRVAFIAPHDGWYYVTISRYNGAATPPAPAHNLIVAYGRYPGNNMNCIPATPRLFPSAVPLSAKSAPAATGVNDLPGAPGTR